MSLTDELAALKTASENFHRDFPVKLAAKVQQTVRADDAGKLNGRTLTQTQSDIAATLTAHKADRKAHDLSFANLQTYDGVDVDAIFKGRPKKGVIPVSRYGNLTYLPAGVSGSFEGATTSLNPRDTVLLLEDDGTLAYLRNGQNGSKLGVYYAYFPNALGATMPQSIKTNRRYQPAYFPTGYTAAWIQSSSESVIFGRLQNSAGALSDYFVSITNGTLDDTKHSGCIIPAATYLSLGFTLGETIVCDDKVVFFGVVSDNDGVLELRVWTLPLVDVIAGGNRTPTRMTGITTTSFMNRQYVTDALRVVNYQRHVDAAQYPLYHNPDSIQPLNVFHFERPHVYAAAQNGLIRLKFFGNSYAPTSEQAQYNYLQFSFVFNPNTKVATLDAQYQGQQNVVRRTNPADSKSLTVWTGSLFNNVDLDEARPQMANTMPHLLYSGQWLFNFRVQQISDSLDVIRVKLKSKITNVYDALLRGNAKGESWQVVGIRPSYGSAIGGMLRGLTQLISGRVMIYCSGKDATGEQFMGLAYSDLEGAPNANYSSLVNGPMVGYKPSAKRAFIKDVTGESEAVVEQRWAAPIVESSPSVVNLSGQHFIEGLRNSNARILNGANFNYSGVMSCSDAVLAAARNTVLAMTGANVRQALCQLIVPRTSGCPAFMVVTYCTQAGGQFLVVAPCTVTLAGDVITGITINSISPSALWTPDAGVGVTAAVGIYNQIGPIAIYDTGTSFLIGLASPFGFLVPGNAPSGSISFRYSKTAGWVWPTNLNMKVWNSTTNAMVYNASTGMGFGMAIQMQDIADYGTKSVFLPIAGNNGDAAFDNWAGDLGTAATRRVIVSQDVAETWMLYFTEPTPLMVVGNYYTLPVTTIDLTTIKAAPANTTFYVYAQVVGGVASYLLETAVPSERSTKIYIGYIRTGDTSIETVAVEKTTKLWYFRPSPVSRGSSFAATSGVPSSVAALTWS